MLTTVLVVSAIGGFFGIVLVAANKKFQVAVDERQALIVDLLPGANCGACGSPGCEAFAAAIVDLNMNIDYCVACSADNKEKIATIMGRKTSVTARKSAHIACRGCNNPAPEIYEYRGIPDCFAAVKFFSGARACNYTCLGLGSCVHSCPFGAIFINAQGMAEINSALCAGCGVCVVNCPQKLISITPELPAVRIFCNNRDAGKQAMSVCNLACISCGACVRACPNAAISMLKENKKTIAVIDYEKCTGCGLCIEKCPRKCIGTSVSAAYIAPQVGTKSEGSGGCLHCHNKAHN